MSEAANFLLTEKTGLEKAQNVWRETFNRRRRCGPINGLDLLLGVGSRLDFTVRVPLHEHSNSLSAGGASSHDGQMPVLLDHSIRGVGAQSSPGRCKGMSDAEGSSPVVQLAYVQLANLPRKSYERLAVVIRIHSLEIGQNLTLKIVIILLSIPLLISF